jgi:hypothetical protein
MNAAISLMDNGNTCCDHLEEPGYLRHEGEQLYYVIHRTAKPCRARVILAGPFATERSHRHISWTRWARFLAGKDIEVIRFDYRGVGESTGRFEDMSFESWYSDLVTFIRFPASENVENACPLILHGLGLGALLARRAFIRNHGSALLMWLPPASGQQMLYDEMKLRLANDFVLNSKLGKSREQYLDEIKAGGCIEVEGFPWTKRLFENIQEFGIPPLLPLAPERPHYIPSLDKMAAYMLGGVGTNPLRIPGQPKPMNLVNPDLSVCFNSNFEWINSVLITKHSC